MITPIILINSAPDLNVGRVDISSIYYKRIISLEKSLGLAEQTIKDADATLRVLDGEIESPLKLSGRMAQRLMVLSPGDELIEIFEDYLDNDQYII